MEGVAPRLSIKISATNNGYDGLTATCGKNGQTQANYFPPKIEKYVACFECFSSQEGRYKSGKTEMHVEIVLQVCCSTS